MRCGHCDHIWPAKADSDNPGEQIAAAGETGPRPPAGLSQDSPEAQAARLLAASRRINHLYALKKNSRRNAIRKIAAIAATIALGAAALYGFRQDVVRQFPVTAAIYASLDLPVNIRGLEFRNVVYEKEFENGLPVLSVRGEIVNITDRSLRVPRIRFGLRDATRQEIYHWTMSLGNEPLAPEKSAKFLTRLASPPSDARDLQVRFAGNTRIAKRF